MFNPQPKPAKRGPKPRKPIARKTRLKSRSKRTAWVREKDAAVQRAIAGEGFCCNCRQWKMLGGNHRIHRRFRETRWNAENIDPCCWECNVLLESLSLSKLLHRFPDSIYREDWL